MKKLLLLLTVLLAGVSGAWATEYTVTVTTGSALWDANSNGTWVNYTSSDWGTTWESENGKVRITSTNTGHINRKKSQIATTNVTISTPDDDVMITGYSITFTSNEAANSTITGGAYAVTSTGTSDSKTFELKNQYCHQALFNVSGKWANVSAFTITYETLPAKTAEGYYIIKNTWGGGSSFYLLAQPDVNPAKIYKKSVTGDAVAKIGLNSNYVWKITSYSSYRMIQNVGTGRYISNFNTANYNSMSQSGSQVNLLNATGVSDSEVFKETDRNSSEAGAIAFRANSNRDDTDCWLNLWDNTDGNPVGYYSTAHIGDRMLLTRVYKVTFNSDTGDELKTIYTSGSTTAADLDDYDYTISGVAKTKEEVVTAINAVSNDDLVIVCSHKRSATISSKAEIDQTKVYSISMKRDAEANAKWMYAKSNYGTYQTYFSTASSQTFDANNQWAFVTVDEGTTYYLYNVGLKCFVMSRLGSSNFMDSKFTIRPITLYAHEQNNASYPLGIKDGSYYFNENGGNLIIDTYSTQDDGNRFSIQAIADVVFDPTEAQAMINSMSSNIPFIVSPEPADGDWNEATTWYQISMRPGNGNGGYYAYIPDDHNYSNQIPLETTTGTKSETDNYRWCITGSAASGYRLYNKKAGTDKVFVFTSGGGGKMQDLVGAEAASLFYLAKSSDPSALAAPTFVFKSTNSYRPNRNGTTNTISSYGYNDTGSEFGFTFDEGYTDNNYYAEYAEKVKPFMDAELSSKYFYLTNAKQKENVWNAPSRYSDGVEHAFYSHDDVTAMRAAVEAYVKKPIASIAVRLKNNNTGKYVSYGTPTWNAAGLICNETYAIAEADLTSVLQFILVSGSNYYIYMPTKGKYVGSQTSGNTAFPLVDEASRAQFTLTLTNTPGVVSINDAESYVSADYPGYLHSAGWTVPGVVNWKASNPSSYWNIEDASVISLEMISPDAVGSGEDVYMSYANNLGLPLNAPDGTTVYIITSQTAENAHVEEVDSKDIPAGNGVILKAEKGGTIEMNIKTSTTETLSGNILVAGDGSTNVAAGNFMLAYNSTDEIAKFYAIGDGGFVVPANKAYLPAMGGGVKALTLIFDDETGIKTVGDETLAKEKSTIYNIAGQRVQNTTKGLYIVNGKKVLVK